MDKKVLEEKEGSFNALMEAAALDRQAALAIIAEVPQAKSVELTMALLKKLEEAGDFRGTFEVLKSRKEALAKDLAPAGFREALRKSSKDRLLTSFVDSCDFGTRPLEESLQRLERLLELADAGVRGSGKFVLSPAWGLGEIKRIDYFYRKITIDFKGRHGQQMTFQTACDTLTIAPEGHVLVVQRADPSRIETMVKEKPAEFVKLLISSYGDLTPLRLEELVVNGGYVKAADYKKFWDAARNDLKKDQLVALPARKSDAIHLKAEAESYGDGWFTNFAAMTDPKQILMSVRLLVSLGKMPNEAGSDKDKTNRATVEERMAFAVKGARGVDDALYAQLACTVSQLSLSKPSCETMRKYLWDHERYLEAAKKMPARETGDLVEFLSSGMTDEAARGRLLEALPRMCFQLMTSVVEAYRKDPACEEAVERLLKEAKAPATLVTYVLGRYSSFSDWKKLPSLLIILGHAIALGEGRQSGETLRMQNMVRRLFADSKWLEKILGSLSPADRESFFERFQASIAWDPSTHHAITMRMTHIAPELKEHLVRPAKKVEAVARVTSFRSYAERKAQYLDVINVQIPQNAKDIEFARGYGDLSENAEYQYAKDKQRELMQTQTLMQKDLEEVKPTDFADVVADSVKPGVAVTLRYPDGSEKAYTILGEWDNDLEKNIISDKTRIAQNLMGRKSGETAMVPGDDGTDVSVTVASVGQVSAEVLEWAKLPAGMSI